MKPRACRRCGTKKGVKVDVIRNLGMALCLCQDCWEAVADEFVAWCKGFEEGYQAASQKQKRRAE